MKVELSNKICNKMYKSIWDYMLYAPMHTLHILRNVKSDWKFLTIAVPFLQYKLQWRNSYILEGLCFIHISSDGTPLNKEWNSNISTFCWIEFTFASIIKERIDEIEEFKLKQNDWIHIKTFIHFLHQTYNPHNLK